ncbi:Do family serine endopeptidase [Desulfobacula toluolica]|uniref:Probable periplasmic serine endoprotease DegP-like n=1 Tax=Desulfobacula toluolica (strain DSM 7467 / Tol2) TaxID=651182 RepID=K0NJQ0_DESTT|nr:Do family serine endopeptidase [Desulfobacula toluolica]CCK81065.1 DegP: serine protease, do-like [Desulfobacula toluolica Tol2]
MKQINKLLIAVIVFGLLNTPVMAKNSHSNIRMVPASFSELAKQAKPGVVNIQTVKNIEGGGRVYKHFFGQPFGGNRDMFDEFFAPFFNQRPENRKESSLGSGFIISNDGYIVTNNHVIKDADKIKVILHDKTEYDATIIGNDPMTDLALIKIKAENLMPLKFGSSLEAEVGSWVVAIGSPFGLEQTVTAGIISAKGRILGSGPYDDFIQTDASINPGNSGGPLLNIDGEVIGINTAIIKSGQGIGFAIPSDLATGVIDQLTEQKTVSRGWMGVAIQNVTEQLAEYYGIKETKGVYVAKVYEDDPADNAGIKVGDVIFQINDKKIESSRDLTLTIAASSVGETVKVKLIRDGKEKMIKVKLGKRPEQDPDKAKIMDEYDSFGFGLKQMDSDMAKKLGYPEDIKGLVVTDIESGSQASKTSVRRGDLLMEVDRYKIDTIEDYTQYLKKIAAGRTVQLLFRRGNSHVFVVSFEKS